MIRLEFELVYNDIAVENVHHFTTETYRFPIYQ